LIFLIEEKSRDPSLWKIREAQWAALLLCLEMARFTYCPSLQPPFSSLGSRGFGRTVWEVGTNFREGSDSRTVRRSVERSL